MQKLLLIAMAGGLGSVCRYSLAGFIQRLAGAGFPLGTFSVNILGSFAFGLIFAFVEHRMPMSTETRMIILTGFMGAFTTFSTFMFESMNLLKYGQWGYAILNLFGQILIGLLCVFTGLQIGKAL